MKLFNTLCTLMLLSSPTWAQNTSYLAGIWELVEAKDLSEKGEWTFPFGETPSGIFAYSSNGIASVQIPTFVGYVGTYTVTEKEIIHHVESAWDQTMVGTDQVRPYELKNDTLILGDQKTWIRILKRVH
jgi:hypothetical protein